MSCDVNALTPSGPTRSAAGVGPCGEPSTSRSAGVVGARALSWVSTWQLALAVSLSSLGCNSADLGPGPASVEDTTENADNAIAGSSNDGAAPVVRLKSANGALERPSATLPAPATLDREASCQEDDIAPTRLRALSPVEYQNTLSDLIQDLDEQADVPAMDLPPVVAVHGFENYAAQLNPTAVLVERQLEISLQTASALLPAATKLLDDACLDAAATVAAGDDPELSTSESLDCSQSLLRELGLLALRRPLNSAELERYGAFFQSNLQELGVEAAAQLTTAALLQAPQLLYRIEDSRRNGTDEPQVDTTVHLNPYETATRLSYLIWQTAPDAELLGLAADGELGSLNEIRAQVARMLDDPRAARAYADFHRQWLGLDKVLEEQKSDTLFPLWGDATPKLALDETRRFLELLYTSGEPTLPELLTSRRALVNDELAAIYGVEATGRWHEVQLDPAERAGILTRVGFLAGRAHNVASPPLRGVAVLRNLLCAPMPNPPANVDTAVPSASEDAPSTNRQRFEAKLSASPSCPACHTKIDGLGYTFERYDAIGQFRTTEAPDLLIDPSGELIGTDVDGPLEDAVELSTRLADSGDVNYCASLNLYRHAYGRDERSQDWCKTDLVYEALTQSGGDFREAMTALATSYEFLHRVVEAPTAATGDASSEETP